MSIDLERETALYVEQLDELLRLGTRMDLDEAVEVAGISGMLARLGATGGWKLRAEAWRDGAGRHLLTEGLETLDGDEILDALDDALAGHGELDLEDVLYDVDEVVLAAWWSKRTESVRPLIDEVVARVLEEPEPFAELSGYAAEILELPGMSQDDLAASVWVAVAEAADQAGLHLSET
jgi:hypothetical protein